jgi:hypothetical protein
VQLGGGGSQWRSVTPRNEKIDPPPENAETGNLASLGVIAAPFFLGHSPLLISSGQGWLYEA